MIRIEIYANVELMDEVKETLAQEFKSYYYTIIQPVAGYGKKGYAFGDTVWPEMNFVCVLMIRNDGVSPESTRAVVNQFKSMCDEIQKSSPQNSITMFAYVLESLL